MNTPSQVPSNYNEWLMCVTHCFCIPLTEDFALSGIQALSDTNSSVSKSLIDRYGKTYHKQVLQWFHKALTELNSN
jgi:hypothetical protein